MINVKKRSCPKHLWLTQSMTSWWSMNVTNTGLRGNCLTLSVCVWHVIETHLPTYCLWHLEPYRIHQDDLKLICMIWHYVCGTSPKSFSGAWSFGILKSTNMILWYELVKCVICNNWYVWDITALTGYCWLIVVIYIHMLLVLILWYIIVCVDRYLATQKFL